MQANQRHPLGMDDIEEVIKKAEHYRFEDEFEDCILNRISSLPTSKVKLKRSIKERIRLLASAYISLASFVSDENVDFLIESFQSKDKKEVKKKSKLYKKVIKEMESLKKEMREFQLS